MRKMAWLAGLVVLFASCARAQSVGASATLPGLLPSGEPGLSLSATPDTAEALPAEPDPALPQQHPPLRGIYPEAVVPWQIGVGYTFFRFYEVPSTTQSQNGFNVSMVYYVRDSIGGDVEIFSTYGSLSGQRTQVIFVGVGPRYRHPLSNRVDVWVHGLVGGSRFTPLTSYGGDSAFGYAAGAGFDLNPHSRIGYRVQADMVGTAYFGTYQISPKVSVGVFFKF